MKNLQFSDILDRLKIFFSVKTNKDLASLVQIIEAQKFNSWSSRNTIPIQELYILANNHNINLHWLLTGVGSPDVDVTSIIQSDEAVSGNIRLAQIIAEKEIKKDELNNILKKFIEDNSTAKNKQELLELILKSIQRQKGRSLFKKIFNKLTGSFDGFLVALYCLIKSIEQVEISDRKDFDQILKDFKIPTDIEKMFFKSHLDILKVQDFFQSEEMEEIDVIEIKYNSSLLCKHIKNQLSKPNQFFLNKLE